MPYYFKSNKVTLSLILERFVWFFVFFFKERRVEGINKILLVEPFQLGDVVSLSVLLKPLKLMYPKSELFFLVKNGNQTMFSSDSRVKEVFTAEFPWSDYGSKKGSVERWIQLCKVLYKLRKQQFDIGIDTRGDIRSQILISLIGCKKRIGHLSYLGSNIKLKGLLLDVTVTEPKKIVHRYDWNIQTLCSLDTFQPEFQTISFPTLEFLDEQRVVANDYILLHIGGGWKYKRWDNDNWIELGKALKRYYPAFKIVVMSGPSEVDDLEYIQSKISDEEITFFSTTFNQMLNLIKYSSLFIGLDSGPMNIAVCLNKKVFALFGPGDSEMWYPYTQPKNFIHKLEFPCIPCFQTTCFFSMDSCMNRIKVTEVLSKLESVDLKI